MGRRARRERRTRRRKANKDSRPCKGTELPESAELIPVCDDDAIELKDCCRVISQGDAVTLVEYPNDDYLYWVIVEADEQGFVACHHEAYIDHTSWDENRKVDYLLLGKDSSDHCNILFVELRETFTKEEHWLDKTAQIQESVERAISEPFAAEIVNTTSSFEICTDPNDMMILGCIIAPTKNRDTPRYEKSKRITVAGQEYFVGVVPPDFIIDCRIGWSKLLEVLGIMSNPSLLPTSQFRAEDFGKTFLST